MSSPTTCPPVFARDGARLRRLLRWSPGVLEESEYATPFYVREVDLHFPLLPAGDDLGFQKLEGDYDRNRAVRLWVDEKHGGDMGAALRESPLLVSEGKVSSGLCPDGTHLMDGWHRLRLARKRGYNGLVTIIVLRCPWL